MKTKRIEQIDKNLRVAAVANAAELQWLPAHDKRFTVKGLPWFRQNKGSFCRFPDSTKGSIPDNVFYLARCPASGRVCFRTDSTRFAVRAEVADVNVMSHMPGTGSNGLILYAGAPGQMRPWATAVPDQKSPAYERELLKDLPRQMREYALYLPSYKPLIKLEIGLSKGARILPPSPPAIKKPVVFYGTSITQGGCANTAGTDYVSRVGRILNLDVVNFGFSGSGRGEPEVAEVVSDVDASLFVLDYGPNAGPPDQLQKTLPTFVSIIRKKHPKTPILLVTDILYWGNDYSAGSLLGNTAKRDVWIEYYIGQKRGGEENIHLADGWSLMPFRSDGVQVDGSHPTDHGFLMMAENIAPHIARILLRDA